MSFSGRRRDSAPRPFTPERAWNYLLFILSRRSYTVAELRERLVERRGLPSEEAEPLLARLVELRLVDDASYTEQYVNSRLSARGRLALRRELKRKGVATDLIERELEGLSQEQQADAATALLERQAWRYRPTAADEGSFEDDDAVVSDQTAYELREQRYRARNRAFAFLARRGFSVDAATAALERVGWFKDE